MASNTRRTTGAVPVAGLAPEVLAALDRYRDLHGLDEDPRATARACVHTRFETTAKRWWGGARVETGTTCAILTATHLYAVACVGSAPPSVLAFRLRDLEVRDYEKTPGFRLVEDAGLELTGSSPGAAKRSTYFVGLGPEPAAVAFREAVRAAIA